MRSVLAIGLGLLFAGGGIFAASAVTPLAYPAAFGPGAATSNPVALFVMLSIIGVFSTFGAWLTARSVEHHRLGHALFMSVVALAVAMFVGAVRWAAAPLWYHIATWLLLPCAALLGTRAWERTMRRMTPRRTTESVVSG
jgi:K+-transporting ATPase A subunit